MKIEESLSSKQMLLDIGAMRKYALALVDQNKPYAVLLREILKEDSFYDEKPMPAIKELVQRTGLKYGKVRNQLLKIYSDLLLDYETKPTLSFTKVSYIFYIKGFWGRESISLEANLLPVAPRVGEDIQLPFLKAYLNTAHFHVSQIEHDFDHDSQTIYIWLEPGFKAWGLNIKSE